MTTPTLDRRTGLLSAPREALESFDFLLPGPAAVEKAVAELADLRTRYLDAQKALRAEQAQRTDAANRDRADAAAAFREGKATDRTPNADRLAKRIAAAEANVSAGAQALSDAYAALLDVISDQAEEWTSLLNADETAAAEEVEQACDVVERAAKSLDRARFVRAFINDPEDRLVQKRRVPGARTRTVVAPLLADLHKAAEPVAEPVPVDLG